MHSVVATPANVGDVTQAGALLHGQEKAAFGDSGYQGVDKRDEAQGPRWHVAMKPGKRRQLDPSSAWARLLERVEQLKASVRAKAEHPFHVFLGVEPLLGLQIESVHLGPPKTAGSHSGCLGEIPAVVRRGEVEFGAEGNYSARVEIGHTTVIAELDPRHVALHRALDKAGRGQLATFLFSPFLTSIATVVLRFAPKRARDVPLFAASLPIFSRDYYSKRPFDETTLEVPLGSGPYKVARFEPGRHIEYERVKNWWGADLPVARGQNNFDIVRYEYYRDREVAFEGFTARSYLFREEFTSRTWATRYDLAAIRDGRIKALGVTTARRAPGLDTVPPIGETVPGYDSAGWSGLVAPAKTPDEIINKVNADLVGLMRDPAVLRQFHDRATLADPLTPAEFAAFMAKDIATWAEVVKATGTKPGT